MEYGLDSSGDVIMRSNSKINRSKSMDIDSGDVIMRSNSKINRPKYMNTSLDYVNDIDDINFRDMYKECCGKKCQYPILDGYKCIRLLGEGTFGSTFLFDNKKGKVAVKIINTNFTDNESEILSILKNSCYQKRILCYNNKFFIGNNMFLITEFINGKTLDNYRIKNALSLYKLIGQLIDSVEFIHSKGVIHFDIKPKNIMVDNDNLKLIDFGGASISKRNKVKLTSCTKFFCPKIESTNMTFNKGVMFDWYTVIITIRYILSKLKHVPNDLKFFEFINKEHVNVNPYNYIIIIKNIIALHMQTNQKSFIKDGFSSRARQGLNTII